MSQSDARRNRRICKRQGHIVKHETNGLYVCWRCGAVIEEQKP